MLVLKRRPGEKLNIEFGGVSCEIEFLDWTEGAVRVGLSAPDEVRITRAELRPIDGGVAGSDAQPEVAVAPPLPDAQREKAGGSLRREGFVPDLLSGSPLPGSAADAQSRTAGQRLESVTTHD